MYSCEAELIVEGDDPVAAFSTTSVHVQGTTHIDQTVGF